MAPIRQNDEYGGFRAALIAKFKSINIPLKIDITTGDVITPEAICYSFPSVFEEKQIEVWAYNLETILAEKVKTILRRSVLNTRPRDFYDFYILMKTHGQAIHPDVFQSALSATVERGLSQEALQNGNAILHAIQEDAVMRSRWNRYCQEYYYANEILFDEVINILVNILGKISGIIPGPQVGQPRLRIVAHLRNLRAIRVRGQAGAGNLLCAQVDDGVVIKDRHLQSQNLDCSNDQFKQDQNLVKFFNLLFSY